MTLRDLEQSIKEAMEKAEQVKFNDGLLDEHREIAGAVYGKLEDCLVDLQMVEGAGITQEVVDG